MGGVRPLYASFAYIVLAVKIYETLVAAAFYLL